MKKKLLFYAPSHFDIDLVLMNELKKLEEYTVINLTNKNYEYNNIWERCQNFLGKIFLKRILKKEWKIQEQINEISSEGPFDLCLIIRPDLLEKMVLQKIKDSIPIRKVFYWDSFEKIPELKETLPYFNEHFSFEEDDCKTYNLKQISNFYIYKNSSNIPEYDAFFFGAHDTRFEKIKQIIEYLYNKGWNAKALIVSEHITKQDDCIEIITQNITFSECYKFTENTKVVIDIAHNNQKGLSIRPFEAMGLKRKLITNNVNIKNYDFYNKNNILIVQNFEKIDIPNTFLESPYQELPNNIYEKYYITNWLKTILNNA